MEKFRVYATMAFRGRRRRRRRRRLCRHCRGRALTLSSSTILFVLGVHNFLS